MRSLNPVSTICAAAIVVALSGAAFAQNNTTTADNTAANGRHVFMQARCFACHGEYGYGGVGPRFREDRFLGMSDYVIGQILLGRGIMPSFADALDNKEIAAVATYVRTSWGNKYGVVNAQEVAKVRDDIKQPPQHGPHVQSSKTAPPGGAKPPAKPLPPGQATPPAQ